MTSACGTDVLGLDVGGANLKAADGRGWAHAESFPLWREPGRLAEALRGIVARRPAPRMAVTMTGEIADCFPDRAAGVSHIVRSVLDAAATAGAAVETLVYLVDGRFVGPAEAVARPLEAAASNWHAVARLAAAVARAERAFLVDVGSTTTDIVPLLQAVPMPLARDDAGRMHTGELVYTGLERTPLPAIVRSLPHRGVRRPLAAERFADSRDAWLLLGGCPEDPDCRDTADGGPCTFDAARVRLARSMLLEPAQFTAEDARVAAAACAGVQARCVARGLRGVADRCGWRPDVVILSGHGVPLAELAVERLGWSVARVSLAERLGNAVARVAPAHAVAVFAAEEPAGFRP